jgi:hypothetical protein
LVWFLSFFFDNFLFYSDFFLIGLSKSFFFRKHAYNFFFNYEFNIFFERIFSFFSLVLLNFLNKHFIYFNIIFDELYSNSNVVFFSNNYFSVDVSAIKTANFFFNKVLVYNYWFYNMHWIFSANHLNKLRARTYPLYPFKAYLIGVKFHFRGRFSRKQRAASFVFERGNMPLILCLLILIMVLLLFLWIIVWCL